MTAAIPHDAYLATRPDDQRACLGQLRGLLGRLLPEAHEVMSYAMPGYRIGNKVVAGYAGFARNCGYYPHSGNIVSGFADDLTALGFHWSRGGVLFTPSCPLPEDLVARLVTARKAELELP